MALIYPDGLPVETNQSTTGIESPTTPCSPEYYEAQRKRQAECEHLNFHVHAHTHIYKGDGIEGPLDGKFTEFSLKCADCGLPFIFPQVRPDTVPKDGCANEDQTVVYHRIEPLGYVTPTQPGSPEPIKIEVPSRLCECGHEQKDHAAGSWSCKPCSAIEPGKCKWFRPVKTGVELPDREAKYDNWLPPPSVE